MKFYAVIKSSSDTDVIRHCVIDDESEIIQLIKEECENCLEIDEMTLDEFEEEYACDFDDYRMMRRRKKTSSKKLRELLFPAFGYDG